jgi:hypothetical protein
MMTLLGSTRIPSYLQGLYLLERINMFTYYLSPTKNKTHPTSVASWYAEETTRPAFRDKPSPLISLQSAISRNVL